MIQTFVVKSVCLLCVSQVSIGARTLRAFISSHYDVGVLLYRSAVFASSGCARRTPSWEKLISPFALPGWQSQLPVNSNILIECVQRRSWREGRA